jgi:hypothetical protein
MRFTGIEHWTPQGWAPHDPNLIPSSVTARTDMQVHPVSNPTAPGYAYGTMKPLLAPKVGMSFGVVPYILPVGKNFTLQVPMKPQIQGVTPMTQRSIAINGLLNSLPVSGDDSNAVQASVSSMQR